jgi:flavin-dependent dehydrogenase
VDFSVVIIGGGPAGATAGRLLASWGHSVLLIDSSDAVSARARGLAESLPPSARKVLAQTGLLDIVDGAGFCRSTGNTVCWESGAKRVERFQGAAGYQIFRPDFDRLLLAAARDAGVRVCQPAHVRDVERTAAHAVVRYGANDETAVARAGWVLDCSGRAGVIGRAWRTPGRRTYALVGEWISQRGWQMADATQTLVEAYADGWSWSIPSSPSVRHAGVMIDGISPGRDRRALADAYRLEIEKSAATSDALADATLTRVWACDASTYSSRRFGDRGALLVGDAGSFLDPLSSAGVKKALASAYLAAVVVNTALVHPRRTDTAIEFFSRWESGIAATHAARSREFAIEAAARYETPFWLRRAEPAGAHSLSAGRGAAVDVAAVQAALTRIRTAATLDLALDDEVRFERQPVIRGREIVVEDALIAPGPPGAGASTDATRFVDNVDVVALARLAGSHGSVPALFEAYCRDCGPAPLPAVLGGLSWLVAAGILRQRNAVPC